MKKIIALLLTLAIVLTFAACSNNGDNETETEKASVSESTTNETTTKATPKNAVEVISSYSNEQLGIDVDRDDENFKFLLKTGDDDDSLYYRVDAAYIVENDDSTVSFDTKGIFYVTKDLSKAYVQNSETDELTEIPTE